MDQLPQELIERIVGNVGYNERKAILTLNKRFHDAAERTFSPFDSMSVGENDLDDFVDIFSRYRRLHLLRVFKFLPKLPTLGRDETGEYICRESQALLNQRDEDYSRQIHALFRAIGAAEERVGEPASFKLILPSPTREIKETEGCIHPSNVSWRVHLLRADSLCKVESVTELKLDEQHIRYYDYMAHPTVFSLDLRVILDLASRLPNLVKLTSSVKDSYDNSSHEYGGKHFYRRWEGPRRDSRHGFIQAFHEDGVSFPRSLSILHLDFDNDIEEMDQRHPLPNLLHPAVPHDLFSSSLRILTQHLRQLKLCVAADCTLFWPAEKSTTSPFWPHLESLFINLHPAHPSGSWYFNGPNHAGKVSSGYTITPLQYPPLITTTDECERWDSDGFRRDTVSSCNFRFVPDLPVLEPFLCAFAKASDFMPCLKEAVLWTEIRFTANESPDDDFDGPGEDVWFPRREDSSDWPNRDWQTMLGWGFAYLAPNFSPTTGRCGSPPTQSGSRQFWWMMGPYHPSLAAQNDLRGIGAAQYGEDLREHVSYKWEDLEVFQKWCLDELQSERSAYW